MKRKIYRRPIRKSSVFWLWLLFVPEFIWMCSMLPEIPASTRWPVILLIVILGLLILLAGVCAFHIEFTDKKVILRNEIYPFLTRTYAYDRIDSVEYIRQYFDFLIISSGGKRSWPLFNIDRTCPSDRGAILDEFRSRGVDIRDKGAQNSSGRRR